MFLVWFLWLNLLCRLWGGMRARSRGPLSNMGSIAGLKGGTPHLLYPMSEGAVVNMTRAMPAHHASQGIRVNCVCPGVSVFSEEIGLGAD